MSAEPPPRQVVDSSSDELSSLPKLLRALGIEVPEHELGDTAEGQRAATQWLRRQERAKAPLHPHLVMGFRIRGWITEDHFEALWSNIPPFAADE